MAFRGDLAEHDRAQRNFDRVESSVADTRVKRRIDKNLGQFVLR
jgi:predicted secreted Zn-dependent protease